MSRANSSAAEMAPWAAPVQEGGHSPGQLPGVRIESLAHGVVDDGQEVAVLGGEPVPGLSVTAELLDHDSGLRGGQDDGISARVDPAFGGKRRMQVVVEQLPDGLLA